MASVLVPLAQGCEELEAVTVIDILRRAQIEVVTVGLDKQIVVASRGTRLLPDKTLDEVLNQSFDMIVLPGGLPGADHLNNDSRIHQLLASMNREKKWIAAICAAPKVLAKAGLLNNRRATSFPGSLGDLKPPGLTYVEDAVVIDGNIVTSRGPGTALDFALSLVEILAGSAKRQQVENPLQRPA